MGTETGANAGDHEGIVVLPGKGREIPLGEAGVVTVKVARAETGGSMTAYEFGLGPRMAGPPEHIHRTWDELFYVLQGTVTFLIDGACSDARPGACIFIPRGVPHTFWNSNSAPVRLLTVFTPSGIEDYFDEASAVMVDGSAESVAAAAAVMERHDMVVVPGQRAAYGGLGQ